jgi:hypothetical protein
MDMAVTTYVTTTLAETIQFHTITEINKIMKIKKNRLPKLVMKKLLAETVSQKILSKLNCA